MADIITDNNPVTLADFESLTNDKPIRSLMHTIRDYTPIFDQAVIQAGNDGFGDRGKIITTYPKVSCAPSMRDGIRKRCTALTCATVPA